MGVMESVWVWEVGDHTIEIEESGTIYTLKVDGEIKEEKERGKFLFFTTGGPPDFQFELDGQQIDMEWVGPAGNKPRCRADGRLVGPEIEESRSESRQLIIVLLIIIIIILLYIMGVF